MAGPQPPLRAAASPRVREAVAKALRRHAAGAGTPGAAPPAGAAPATAAPSRSEVLRPMPRRAQTVRPTPAALRLPEVGALSFHAGFLACVKRLALWAIVGVGLLATLARDRLTGHSTIERRAQRLRESLERVGGTFAKLGQQVAMRIDLLPWEYCVEFAKMLDRMSPFPTPEALAAVERAIGRPWQEVFSAFDPEPIGSASIACVYQAHLRDGTRVAVKVRRPGIGETFAADFRVLDWLLGFAEALSIIRPGFTVNLRRELRETLLEELDFRKEAQFQHAFRRNARRRARRDFFTAPRAYFELSNDEVLVQEFVTGMWLWELIATVEQNDAEGHAMMRRLNIDPALVARRILWATFWSIDENLFFHADPHPANIIVGQDSTLTFIDFGSCGAFDHEKRWTAERIAECMRMDDVEGMARATLKLLEPLPPVDLQAVKREVQAEYVRVLSTFRTKARHTEWWERTSAKLWLVMVSVAKQHNLPIGFGTLKMIRATLLYDTLVLRLDRSVDRYHEYERFRRDRATFARRRWRRRVGEAREQFMLRSSELLEAGDELLDRAQHTLSSPLADFGSLIDKSAFAFTTSARLVWRLGAVTVAAAAIVAVAAYVRTGALLPAAAAATVAGSPVYQVFAGGMVVLTLRHIFMRLLDREVPNPRRG